MSGDGNGWVTCDRGHRHWGRFGAAGLLLRWSDETGQRWILLQHRVAWSHEGGTWGLPGGARDSHEVAAVTALREANEEVGISPEEVQVRTAFVDDHGRWAYTTIVADAGTKLPAWPRAETTAALWVPEPEVPAFPLHPGFSASWEALRGLD